MSTVRFGTSSGTVTTFDDASGLGTIGSDERQIPFHCIAIADGTRSIEVGTAVTFELLAKLGRYEAADIRPA